MPLFSRVNERVNRRCEEKLVKTKLYDVISVCQTSSTAT